MINANNLKWGAGMVTCVCGALLGQAEVLAEPYRHYLTILMIVGTAVSGFMVQRPYPYPEPQQTTPVQPVHTHPPL